MAATARRVRKPKWNAGTVMLDNRGARCREAVRSDRTASGTARYGPEKIGSHWGCRGIFGRTMLQVQNRARRDDAPIAARA